MNETKLYIALISIHGLIRGNNLELGKDADTGGQTKYVVELARALAKHPKVERVDLLTRLIQDARFSDDYAVPEEQIAPNAWIVRIPCGPKRYLRKEALWPCLDSFTDLSLHHIRKVGKIPDIIHSHYADAGYIGANLASLLAVPLIFTGHSLGREKQRRLMEKGMSRQEVQQRYNIDTRIDAEEYALSVASAITASTRQEIEVQYEAYERYQPKKMHIVPPGIDTEKFHGISKTILADVKAKVDRFLAKPTKPMILAIARADERKNFPALVEAYAQNERLRELANLVIVAGVRENIATMESGAKKVLTQILMLIDRYDLYGHAAYPKDVQPFEVPALYTLASKSKGVFVNAALTEPFGLTLIEAATAGLPLIATNDGGPRDIIANCKNGLLVDPLDPADIGNVLMQMLEDKHLRKRSAANGKTNVNRYYTWRSHANQYVKIAEKLLVRRQKQTFELKPVRKLPMIRRMMVADIDNTLLGDPHSLGQLMDILDATGMKIGFGVATGRHIESAVKVLKEWNVPAPDFYITSVGTEIHYGKTLHPETGWSKHIAHAWEREKIIELFSEVPGLKLQSKVNQRAFKVSFYVDAKRTPKKREIQRMLREAGLSANIIFSRNAFLDLIPIRASKGHAVRYLALKWGLNLGDILVAGDSGNDESMLKEDALGVVVGNYSQELAKLKGKVNIYFADTHYAGGIVEGLRHFSFLDNL